MLDTNAVSGLLAGDRRVLDVWIAAHAIETGSCLVTYDKHFSAVPGLLLWERL